MSRRHIEHALALDGTTTLCGLPFYEGQPWVIADKPSKIDCGSCSKLLGIESARYRKRQSQSRRDKARNEARNNPRVGSD